MRSSTIFLVQTHKFRNRTYSCLQSSYMSIVVPAQDRVKQTWPTLIAKSSLSRILRNVGLYAKFSTDAGSCRSHIILSTFKPIVSSHRSLSLQRSLLSSGPIHSRRQPCPLPSFLRLMLLATSMPSYAKRQL